MIDRGEIDVAVADIWLTEQRKEVATFTDPIMKQK